MSYWFNPDLKAHLMHNNLSEAQAYLIGEMAYGLNAEVLLSQTFATTPTIRALVKKELAVLDKAGIKIGLTENGKELVLKHRTDWRWNARAYSA